MATQDTVYRVKEFNANLSEENLLNVITAQATDGYQLFETVELKNKVFLIFKDTKRVIL